MNELEDLIKIQRETGNIVEHITSLALEQVDKGPIHEMRALYMPKATVEV